MPMPKTAKFLPSKVCFVAVLIFSSVFVCYSDRQSAFLFTCDYSIITLLLKLLLCIVLCALASFWLMYKTNDYAFAAKALCSVTVLTSVLIVADMYVFRFYGSNFMYQLIHVMYFMAAVFSSFIAVTLHTAKHPQRAYKTFYKWLWISVTPILLFLFIRVFIRNPNTSYSVNLEPFYRIQETLSFIAHNFHGGMEQTYIFLGNILFFVPIGFLIPFYLKRLPGWAQCLIGFLLPVLIEVYQWVFRCGDVDVDDVILNYTGFLLGFAICKLIEIKVLKKLPQNSGQENT